MGTETSTSIEDRLTKIEASIDRLTSVLNQAPDLMSIAVDSSDDLIMTSKQNDISVDHRIQDGIKLLGRLSDPEVNKVINGLLDALEQGPGLISIVADTIDTEVGRANAGSVTLDDRIRGISNLITKLSDPTMVEKVDSILNFADQAPGLMAMTMDSVDGFMKNHGTDLIDSLAFLQKDNLVFIKKLSDSLCEAQAQPPAKVRGIFGMLRTLKDPAIQKTLGFLMNILKNLGNKI